MLGLGIAAEMSWTMAVASNGAAVGEAESTAVMSTTGMGPVYLRRLGIPDAEDSQVGPRSVVGWEDQRVGLVFRSGVSPEEAFEEAALLARFLLVCFAAPACWHTASDRVDVLAASGPGGLATGLAGDCSAHRSSP